MTLFSAALTLFLVMDSLGNIPLFISVLRNVDDRRRRLVILREMLIALGVLTLFLFFGRLLLNGLQISEASLSMGGGVVLFLIAIKMIFPSAENSIAGGVPHSDPIVVPLAVPLIAGPSSIATVMLIATQHPERVPVWFLALFLAWLASCLILVSADRLRRRLGSSFLVAIERLMGMILVTLSFEMLIGGLTRFLEQM
ncbi:MAG: MarC family protein [Spirochaetaceae bacterium]